MIKVVLLDLDGTLIDSERYYCEGTYEWIQRFGFKGRLEDVYPIIGTTMDETCRIIAEELLNGSMTCQEVYDYNAKFFREEKPMICSDYIFEEVKASVIKLKEAGYRLAICSSSTLDEIDFAISSLGFKQYIDFIDSSHECEHGKPAPDVYLSALNYFDVEPQEAIVVEDSYSGILAGKNANIYTIARKDYRFNIDQSMADAYVDGLDEVYDLIKEIDDGRCNHN